MTSFQRFPERKSVLFRLMVSMLYLMGVGGLLGGGIRLGEMSINGFKAMQIADALFNLLAGGLVLVCWRLLIRGSGLVIWLFGGASLFMIGYGFLAGRGFNIIFASGGLLIISVLIGLRQKGEIK